MSPKGAVPNSYLRRKLVTVSVADDNSVMVCRVCDISDAGLSHKIEGKADRHAREHRHHVTVWRTQFIHYDPTKAPA